MVQHSMCRQGLVLVENGEGALAMGGIDEQYQVSNLGFWIYGTIVICLQILVHILHLIISKKAHLLIEEVVGKL